MTESNHSGIGLPVRPKEPEIKKIEVPTGNIPYVENGVLKDSGVRIASDGLVLPKLSKDSVKIDVEHPIPEDLQRRIDLVLENDKTKITDTLVRWKNNTLEVYSLDESKLVYKPLRNGTTNNADTVLSAKIKATGLYSYENNEIIVGLRLKANLNTSFTTATVEVSTPSKISWIGTAYAKVAKDNYVDFMFEKPVVLDAVQTKFSTYTISTNSGELIIKKGSTYNWIQGHVIISESIEHTFQPYNLTVKEPINPSILYINNVSGNNLNKDKCHNSATPVKDFATAWAVYREKYKQLDNLNQFIHIPTFHFIGECKEKKITVREIFDINLKLIFQSLGSTNNVASNILINNAGAAQLNVDIAVNYAPSRPRKLDLRECYKVKIKAERCKLVDVVYRMDKNSKPQKWFEGYFKDQQPAWKTKIAYNSFHTKTLTKPTTNTFENIIVSLPPNKSLNYLSTKFHVILRHIDKDDKEVIGLVTKYNVSAKFLKNNSAKIPIGISTALWNKIFTSGYKETYVDIYQCPHNYGIEEDAVPWQLVATEFIDIKYI